jgi:hypothetical protein
MKRLQPLLPETLRRNGCRRSSMHIPRVRFSGEAPGSICSHLQFRHNPHAESLISLLHPVVSRENWGNFHAIE